MNCDSTNILCQDDHPEDAISDTIHLGGNSIVVTNLDLSNFSASVIHDMQVLGIVPIEAQQFLSESCANMAQNNEIVDLDENTSQPFQLVVPIEIASLVCFFAFYLFWFSFAFMEGFGFCPPSFLYFSFFRLIYDLGSAAGDPSASHLLLKKKRM